MLGRDWGISRTYSHYMQHTSVKISQGLVHGLVNSPLSLYSYNTDPLLSIPLVQETHLYQVSHFKPILQIFPFFFSILLFMFPVSIIFLHFIIQQ